MSWALTDRTTAGISHPIQTFSYALKLRLEFVVLNQLMAVAARGLGKNRDTTAEKRYHYPSSMGASTAKSSKRLEKDSIELHPSNTTVSENDSIQISAPPPSVLKSTNPATAQSVDSVDDLHQYHGSSSVGKSNWYPPHMESPLRNLLPQQGDRARERSDKNQRVPIKVKRRRNGLRRNDQDEPEEETIGYHEWENNGRHVLVVPWFREGMRDA